MRTYTLRTLLIITALIAVFGGIAITSWRQVQQASLKSQCGLNLRQIGIGLLNFESAHGRLPQAIETTLDGKHWRSWRSHLPSFLESGPLIYDETSAWDSPKNLRLLQGLPIEVTQKDGTPILMTVETVPYMFACPLARNRNCDYTTYVVVVGEETAFPDSRSVRLDDIEDGLENTILLVESVTCRPAWTEPRDLDFASMDFRINSFSGPSISSFHPDGAFVCFADGKVFFVTTAIEEHELKALLTIAGGENVTRADLTARGILIQR